MRREKLVAWICLWSLTPEHASDRFGVPLEEARGIAERLIAAGYLIPRRPPDPPGNAISAAGCKLYEEYDDEAAAEGLLQSRPSEIGSPLTSPDPVAVRRALEAPQ